MASERRDQLEGRRRPVASQAASNGGLPQASTRRARLAVVPAESFPAHGFRIVRTAAAVDAGGVVSMFALDAQPHPAWQGAFARALAGTLGDMAEHWRFDDSAIAVARVRPGRASDVAVAVQAAVEAANGVLAGGGDGASASPAAAAALEREAVDAAASMRAALGV